MYCPKCGTENSENAKVCSNCSFVLISAGAAATPTGRTSRLAIASLVLALLGFCTFFITWPLAVILGIISLIKISRSHGQLKGTGMAIVGTAFPVVMLPIMGILMAILMPALHRVKIVAQRVTCGTNMAALGNAMSIYAGDHNDTFPTPSKWCDLLNEHAGVDKKEFRCLAVCEGPCNYAMNKNIVKAEVTAPPDMVLLFESKPGWNQSGGPEILSTENHQGEGCNILFNDGHVKFVLVEDINELRWTAE